MWIRIHKEPEYGSNLDPDPQHCIILWLGSCIRGIDSLHCYVHTINVSVSCTFSSLIFCSKHSTWATNEQAKSFQWALWVFAKIFTCKVLHLRVRTVNYFADIPCQHSVAKSFYPVHMGPAWTLRFFTRKGSNGDSHKTLSLYYYYFFLSVLFLVDTVWQKDIYYQKGFFNLIGTFYYKI